MRNAEQKFKTVARTSFMLLTACALLACGCRSSEAPVTTAAQHSGSFTPTPAAALPKKEQPATTMPAELLGNWSAISKTSESITGAIAIEPAAVRFKGMALPVNSIRRLSDVESNAIGGNLLPGATSGVLLKIGANANPPLLNGNTLCNKPAEWIAAMSGKGELSLAVFQGPEGSQEPALEGQALANSKDLCGTFTYGRP